MLDYTVYRVNYNSKRNLYIIEAQSLYNDGRRSVWTEVAAAVTRYSAEKKLDELYAKDNGQ